MQHVSVSASSLRTTLARLTGGEAPAAVIPRVVPDAAWLLRGNPDHPEHDALGLRNGPVRRNPDLVFIGGDQVYGSGVGPEETWPARLERWIGSGVLNAGMPGWGSVQYALAAEELSVLSPKRMLVCLSPANDLVQAFYCAGLSAAPLARSFHEPHWINLAQPDAAAMTRSERAIELTQAKHPELAHEDVLDLLAQRGEPDVDLCTLEASRFYLTPHSLFAKQNLEHPAVEAGLTVTIKVLRHLRDLALRRGFALSILLLPTREYLVSRRLDEALLRDDEALERLGMAEALVLGELRLACSGLGLRCFDLTEYLTHFVGRGIHVQNSRLGQLSARGCDLLARFVRERVLPGSRADMNLRTAAGGSYFLE